MEKVAPRHSGREPRLLQAAHENCTAHPHHEAAGAPPETAGGRRGGDGGGRAPAQAEASHLGGSGLWIAALPPELNLRSRIPEQSALSVSVTLVPEGSWEGSTSPV